MNRPANSLAARPDLITLSEAIKHSAAMIADALCEVADALRETRDRSGDSDTGTGLGTFLSGGSQSGEHELRPEGGDSTIMVRLNRINTTTER